MRRETGSAALRQLPLNAAHRHAHLDGDLVTIAGAGYFLQEEKPSELAGAVLHFIADNP